MGAIGEKYLSKVLGDKADRKGGNGAHRELNRELKCDALRGCREVWRREGRGGNKRKEGEGDGGSARHKQRGRGSARLKVFSTRARRDTARPERRDLGLFRLLRPPSPETLQSDSTSSGSRLVRKTTHASSKQFSCRTA